MTVRELMAALWRSDQDFGPGSLVVVRSQADCELHVAGVLIESGQLVILTTEEAEK